MSFFGRGNKRRSKSGSRKPTARTSGPERNKPPHPALHCAYPPAQTRPSLPQPSPHLSTLLPYGGYSQSTYHLRLPPPTAPQAPYHPYGSPTAYQTGPCTQNRMGPPRQAMPYRHGGVNGENFIASAEIVVNPPDSGLPYVRAECRSYVNLSADVTASLLHLPVAGAEWRQKAPEYVDHGSGFCDRISSRFNDIITSMDGELFSGDERELIVHQQKPHIPKDSAPGGTPMSRGINNALLTTAENTNLFSKVWQYSNSRLPPYLPPLKVYVPTYPLLCLAAQYSQRAYARPTGRETETQHIDADWRHGTKAIVMTSVPIDDMNTIVFAIRGSQTFMDWAVNFRPAPSSPEGFLDDGGNLCHSGFLNVARNMVKPVAARLTAMIRDNPTRRHCSLVITGHSAGGAVAALLFAHMMSRTIHSELVDVVNLFKRVHCVTFGAPPVSLLPLQKPPWKRWDKSVFFSFINEGDPVTRADKAYIKSLLRLYALPAPNSGCLSSLTNVLNPGPKPAKPQKANTWPEAPTPLPVWKVPPPTLCNAGRLVLLRDRGKRGDHVEACLMTQEQLNGVVFGDPMMHMMRVYQRRIEVLATRAVTGKAY